ncbi:N-acetyltransferase [Altererythrobacter aquiaggeris]|uniref:GNAT family N-acetyltransferase n=1 Tax=Aestuarierythrobacter aquiaggeris TaxID=1898396 RepID=UPI00301A2217
MANIIPLGDVDPGLIEALLDAAFGQDRHKRTAYRIREGQEYLPPLSFAALDEDDMLAGAIQAWPVALTDDDGRRHPMVMIGPVAVLPEKQNDGYGKALMLATLGGMAQDATLPQVMIGDPEYYERFFEFTAAHTSGWRCPGPFEQHRLLVRTPNPAILPSTGMLGPWDRPN